ncbi:MAG: polysaccharide pyruvyl transferase family protein [Gemmobacter sp.]|uniref:polysaccharide pyruvyl transferase family protein n=1 Tax=Gemmobacter sp. TaxID=1898957 RepID=UPI001A404CBE|nr:polysaccharide pyruvyl transferase family protein [Gemmobacter sp.]MBL8561120.1 polysaccharide pyruvyl transferase family protein [Gemmobacter sp.]
MTSQKTKPYDIGILGWWYGKNYGSILTYFGLNRAIEGLGYKVLMVHEPLGYNGYRVQWPDDMLSMDFARRMGYAYTKQQHYTKLPKLNEEASTFVVGSDQLWNPVIGRVNDDLFLDFVSPENRRVAYATSFGNRGITKFKPDFVAKHSENLKKFSAISVRENYAIATAQDVFGVAATQVVDPVFLLPRETYDGLAAQATAKAAAQLSGDYLAVFYLDPNAHKRDLALSVADKLGLQKIVVVPNPDNGRKLVSELFTDPRFEILAEDAPENFLSAYRNSRYVVTDSFHGTAFAVIFGKPFSSIYNTHRGADRFKSLLGSLGFGETRRLLETDTPEAIRDNPNVGMTLDYSTAYRRIEAGRRTSTEWLKAALGTTGAAGGTLLGAIKSIIPAKSKAAAGGADRIDLPAFSTNSDAWTVTAEPSATRLSVAPGGAIRGNLVWCDLPFELLKDAAYRLTITWKVQTSGKALNLHVRNPDTGKFRVIGTVEVTSRSATSHTDTVDFMMPEAGFSQFMLGAVHFSGDGAGARIESITVQEIPKAAMQVAAGKKAPSHAELALKLALDDNERFVTAHAKSMQSKLPAGARARMMFHAHAIEKGLSRSDFRGGFGKISVPGLAKEMNAWLAAGRSTQDVFFRTGAAVMRSYFDRHKTLRVDVSDFRALFAAPIQAMIDAAPASEGGVLAARAEREVKVDVNPENRFLDVVYGRRSVRDFTTAKVEDADIRRAVQIAMQAPSVCNRQAARVHQFEDQAAIKAALDLQGGFGGYKMPPKLLLVTADLTAFLFASERNQAFIDGGLFMMNLLLGLQQVGLGSCSLNTAMNTEREMAIRKILGIPDNEIFISFVAVGHYDPAVLTPQSKRVPVEEVLVRHGKTAG